MRRLWRELLDRRQRDYSLLRQRTLIFFATRLKMIINTTYKGLHAMNNSFCLRSAKVNQMLKIVTVTAEGELGRRIRDLGLIPGTECKVIGKAPLKDPVALRLKDFTLTLRNSEADHVTVAPLED
jgi:ferrous iron transport protein A